MKSMTGCRGFGFFHGVGFALAACLLALVLNGLTWPWFSLAARLVLIASVLSLLYIGVLVRFSRYRQGRFLVLLSSALIVGGLTLLPLSWPVFISTHLVIISLARTVLYHRSVMFGLLDIVLNLAAVLVGVWSLLSSGSLLLSVWSCFLIQSLFVFIPQHLKPACGRYEAGTQSVFPWQRFDHAYARAESALQKMARG